MPETPVALVSSASGFDEYASLNFASGRGGSDDGIEIEGISLDVDSDGGGDDTELEEASEGEASGGGLLGVSEEALDGGLFGVSAEASGGGLFGVSEEASGGGLLGVSAEASGGGLLGVSAEASDGGLFGVSTINLNTRVLLLLLCD